MRASCSAVLLILAEVLNFCEQIGVFLIQADQQGSNEREKRFLYALSGVSAANLLNSLLLTSRKGRAVFSIFIDLAEMIAYLILLERTPALIVLTSSLTGLEIMCHASSCLFIDPSKRKVGCHEPFTELGIEFIAYVSVNALPFMTIFIADRSLFRGFYFEILLIVFVFFGNALPLMIAEMVRATRCRKLRHISTITLSRQSDEQIDEFMKFMRRKPFFLKCWLYVKFLIALLVNFFVMPISLFAISVLQVRKNLTNLPEYDQVVYKLFTYLLGAYAFIAFFLIPYLIFFLCQLCRYELKKTEIVLESIANAILMLNAKQGSGGHVVNKKFNVF